MNFLADLGIKIQPNNATGIAFEGLLESALQEGGYSVSEYTVRAFARWM